YEVRAAVAFLDSVPDRPRAQAAADRLGRLVRRQRLAVLDPDDRDAYPVAPGYAPGEHHFPHDYAPAPRSLARSWFTDAEMARSLDFLVAEQREDGGWPVRWRPWAPAPALESRTPGQSTARPYARRVRSASIVTSGPDSRAGAGAQGRHRTGQPPSSRCSATRKSSDRAISASVKDRKSVV